MTAASQAWNGILDDVRIENIARHYGDILNMYNGMNSTTTYYTVGAQEGRRSPVRLGANPGFLAASNTWYSSSWQYRKRITLNAGDTDGPGTSSKGVATTTTLGSANTPTLISLSDTSLTTLMVDGCNDVLFTQADGTTKLSHEVESCNKTSGEFNAWVNTALSSTTNTILYMYYGGYGDQQDRKGTWEEEYKGVWHLSEDPSISTDGHCRGPHGYTNCDATSNNGHATSSGSMTATDQVGGRVGGAIDFDGTDDYLPSVDNLITSANDVSMSAWVKPSDTGTTPKIILMSGDTQGAGGESGFRFRILGTDLLQYSATVGTDSTESASSNATISEGGVWTSVVAVK